MVSNVITAVLAFGLAFIAATYWYNKSTRDNKAQAISDGHIKLVERVEVVESQLALLNQAVVPLSAAFQEHLVKMLTHYHTPAVDLLLAKSLKPKCMTEKEADDLGIAMNERTTDMGDQISPEERIAAGILIDVIKLATIQAKDEKLALKPFQLRLVAVEVEKEK